MLVIMTCLRPEGSVSCSCCRAPPGRYDSRNWATPFFASAGTIPTWILYRHAKTPIQSGRRLASNAVGARADAAGCPHGKPETGAEASQQKVHCTDQPSARNRSEKHSSQPSQAVHGSACLWLRTERNCGLVRHSAFPNATQKSLTNSHHADFQRSRDVEQAHGGQIPDFAQRTTIGHRC